MRISFADQLDGDWLQEAPALHGRRLFGIVGHQAAISRDVFMDAEQCAGRTRGHVRPAEREPLFSALNRNTFDCWPQLFDDTSCGVSNEDERVFHHTHSSASAMRARMSSIPPTFVFVTQSGSGPS